VSAERLTGWGRTPSSVATVREPTNEDEVLAILATERAVVPRGLGRSYGDAALLAGGVALSNRALTHISPVGPDGTVTVGAGVSYDELLRTVMPLGWFTPVSPGTRQVTMGGAMASDVHGKSHHRDGSFASRVRSLRLATPTGLHVLSRNDRPELFWATAGGMGLTGVVTELTIELVPITTGDVVVDTDRFNSLAGVMDEMVARDAEYRFSVAWVDCVSRGARAGRSFLERANFALDGDPPSGPSRTMVPVPFDAPGGLLNRLSVRVFNEAVFRRAPKHARAQRRALATYLYPLDAVRDWNRLYGARGFVQYQFVVPDDRRDAVAEAVDRLAASGVPSFLAVLKRFGPPNPGPLSFPIAGWTLALDLPVGPPALPALLDDLDALVATNGGRVYLAKDARLDPAFIPVMYPRLSELARARTELDPAGVLVSDLAHRLALVGG
jgi:decaprenylphospho-beta-D-ribofuranose 2-oxidase